MHFQRGVLFPIALLTASVSAFYPVVHSGGSSDGGSGGSGAAHPKREPFYIVDHAKDGGDPSKPPTVNIRRGARFAQRYGTPVKRDNKYPIQSGTPPDYPNSMAVHNDGSDYSYFSTFKIGSSGKEVWLLIDTGATHTWMFGSDCKSAACTSHRTFGSSDSTSLKTTSNPYNVSYGTGTVKGSFVSDDIAFAGFKTNIPFGLVNDASSEFLQFPIDGILGLGRNSIKDPNSVTEPTVMDALASQKAIKSNIIGINIWRHSDNQHNGQITFGDFNPGLVDGDFTYTKVTGSENLWGIPLDDASVNGKNIGFKNKRVVVDTGTSAILIPSADVEKLASSIPGAVSGSDTMKIPCDFKGSIKFTFSGVSWEIAAVDVLSEPDKSSGLCTTNILARQIFGVDDWLVGDTFLKNVYAVFDFDKSRIGFAKKPAGGASKSVTPSSSSSSTATGQSSSSSSSSTSTSSSSSSSETSTPTSASSPASRVLLSPGATGAKSPAGSSPAASAQSATQKPSETPTQSSAAITNPNVSIVGAIATVIVTVYVTVS